jgi:hypothetical protein
MAEKRYQCEYTETILQVLEDGEQTREQLQSLQRYTADFVGTDASEFISIHDSLNEAFDILQQQS